MFIMLNNLFKTTRSRILIGLSLLFCITAVFFAIFSVVGMPGVSYRGQIASASSDEKLIEINLRSHVESLAGKIGPRNSEKSLIKAIEYISNTLRSYGYKVKEQPFEVEGSIFKNLEVEISGSKCPDEIVLVGAHYDTARGSPGANDNGSGVATVLELAREFAGKEIDRTIRFVFFTNEEPPYFRTTNMGSYHYADHCSEKQQNIRGLLVMETLGYYTEQPKTQKYPLNFFPGYPSTGNYIAFIGNQDSRKLTEQCVETFRKQCKFPSEGIAAPDWIIGVDWSDQYWFWRNNIPAIMITDTAPYRYPYYHSSFDTPEKLNYPYFAKVVNGLSEVLKAVSSKT
jgi:hypothetical protein